MFAIGASARQQCLSPVIMNPPTGPTFSFIDFQEHNHAFIWRSVFEQQCKVSRRYNHYLCTPGVSAQNLLIRLSLDCVFFQAIAVRPLSLSQESDNRIPRASYEGVRGSGYRHG